MSALVKYQKNLPLPVELLRAAAGKNLILIYDERLAAYASFKKWSANFKNIYPVHAGENLKRIEDFAFHVKKLLPMLSGFSPQESIIVAAGGGSVGDFAGFIASVLKRGVGYIHLPSTWLAAVDSAHGGKTGLNVESFKNQVGSFYEAKVIYCVRDILDLQPTENLRSGYGELIKIAVISGGALYKEVCKIKLFDDKNFWRLLPKAVMAKNALVKKDPYERRGVRQLLNLGHTLGHAYELERLLPHGLAVQIGLEFSTEWSYRRKILKLKDYEILKSVYSKNKLMPEQPLDGSRLQMRLKQDKKAIAGDRLRFVFLKKPGQAIIEQVKVEEIISAAREMGWAK